MGDDLEQALRAALTDDYGDAAATSEVALAAAKAALKWAANLRIGPVAGSYEATLGGSKAVAAYRQELRNCALLSGSQWTRQEVREIQAAAANGANPPR